MGMNQAMAKNCIPTNCRAVVMHASKHLVLDLLNGYIIDIHNYYC